MIDKLSVCLCMDKFWRNTHTYTHTTYKVDFVLEQEYAGFPSICNILINNNNKIKQ